jgi:hypothetical protein
MVCGFATELWSRPHYHPDGTVNDWRVGFTRWYSGSVAYSRMGPEEKLGTALVPGNFVRRMLPHVWGYVPMTGAWVMMIKYGLSILNTPRVFKGMHANQTLFAQQVPRDIEARREAATSKGRLGDSRFARCIRTLVTNTQQY